MAAARLQARTVWHGTGVHPADLDDALCTGALASSGEGGGETRLPFAVDDASLDGAQCELWAIVGRQGTEAMSVRLGSCAGETQAQLDGFKSRALRMEAPTAPRHLYTTEWHAFELEHSGGASTHHPSASAREHATRSCIGGVAP